jgi:hypothetical protein
MALGRYIIIILTFIIVISLVFVSGCAEQTPGPEDLFNPESLEEVQHAEPPPVTESPVENFNISKFFPSE